MGCWENTTYLRHGSAAAVADAIAALAAREGMRRVARPAERERKPHEPMQYGRASQNNLWGVAVIPGRGTWTGVNTAPLDGVRRSLNAPRHRVGCAPLFNRGK